MIISKKQKKLNKDEQVTASAIKLDSDLVLEVRNVSKIYKMATYSTTALDNVNLKIKKGEFTAVVGPSGSGKTTLINCLGALDFPNTGEIIYNVDGKGLGIDVTKMTNKQHKKMRLTRLGFIFQFYNLFPILSAFENVELPMMLAKKDIEEREARVKKLLTMVNLGQRMEHLPTQMSGGEQQRVTIARSMANEPLLLLADEPTGELDTETTTQIIKIFLELRAAGQSILMVTHNKRIAQVADRIITLTDGKIIDETTGGKTLEEIWEDK